MKQRLLPGIFMVVLWILLLSASSFIFWCVLTIGTAIALYEFFRMIDKTPGTGVLLLSVLTCLIPVLVSADGSPSEVLIGSYLALLGLVVLTIFFYTRFADPLAFLIHSGFAVFYIALCSSFLVLLRFLPAGNSWLLVLTAITAGSDTGAYYSGRAFGKKKLCPSISPAKTINGAIGGVLVAVLAATLIGVFFLPDVGMVQLALAAALLAVVGIAGDLAESIIKRGTGIKDSGTLLGGHGGLLDRIDSLLLTAPLLYLLLTSGVLR
ncbi:phosphatidate cytidylyltransferase [Candidatus Electrothrix aarhusensis]|uniref:Phosphatidate cytidylyltransferase n=1 Tax=Candidatus Electrothrix aarhusensis TaxID=1859131 RepID=A0A444IUP9_9BACT|nr:phosphatidate cytidylyltransferase [Candidatus Electrothrix aarhusensis]